MRGTARHRLDAWTMFVLENSGPSRPAPRDGSGAKDPTRTNPTQLKCRVGVKPGPAISRLCQLSPGADMGAREKRVQRPYAPPGVRLPDEPRGYSRELVSSSPAHRCSPLVMAAPPTLTIAASATTALPHVVASVCPAGRLHCAVPAFPSSTAAFRRAVAARNELLKMASDPDPVDKHVGNRIRLRRLDIGCSQTKLAKAVGNVPAGSKI